MVIFRSRILLLYKNRHGRHVGWVLPKGALEPGESYKAAALREVKEETGVVAKVRKYIGKTQYSFYTIGTDQKIIKTVYWYLMAASSFECKPQAEEYFIDVGFYKEHEAYHLLKFHDERQVMTRAFAEYKTKSNIYSRKDESQNAQSK